MDENTWKWVKTALISAVGGGLSGAFAAAMDPNKYKFPRDFGTGRLWPFFFQGAGLVLVGILLKSPLGQKVLTSFKDSQAQLQASKQAVQDTKADLKAGVAAPPEPPPTAAAKQEKQP